MIDSNPARERHWTNLMAYGLSIPAHHSIVAGRLIKRLGTCPGVLECGGGCCLTFGHVVPCECPGDEPGEPGTCPA